MTGADVIGTTVVLLGASACTSRLSELGVSAVSSQEPLSERRAWRRTLRLLNHVGGRALVVAGVLLALM